MLMNRSASTSAESASALPGKWIVGRPDISLMAFAVSERFWLVTPVDPPMKTASVPASFMRFASSPACAAGCLSGSRRATWSVPSEILSRRYCLTVITDHTEFERRISDHDRESGVIYAILASAMTMLVQYKKITRGRARACT